uniref:glycerophosphodiester phosphodiesterase n=1 Tax=Ciona savignyi TaxID=51511 RepID=H2YK04_CIOSA
SNETYRGLPQDRPLNIAHRGSSGMRPEHTVAAYQLAVDQGADIIECDLAVTKDLKLVCSHDPYLNATTNVHSHPEFNSRVQTYTFGAITMTDYFIFDFTLAELKTLRKVQNRKYRDQSYNGLFPIATFDEYVAVAKFAPRTIGIYPETKQPALFNHFISRHNVTMEDLLLEALESHGYTSRDSPCFIQSFDESSLQYMAKRTDLPLVHLTDTVPSNEKLTEIASYCYGMGVSKNLIVQV